MLSAKKPVPISGFQFSPDGRRLSIHTEGRTITSHEGLPSPEHLTPINGTPAMTPRDGSPTGSDTDSPAMSREVSEAPHWNGQDGGALSKVNSRGGLWHEDVSDESFPDITPSQVSYLSVHLGYRFMKLFIPRMSMGAKSNIPIHLSHIPSWSFHP